MKRALLGAMLMMAFAGSSSAEEVADVATPLVLNVTPSRFEDSLDEQLMRRARNLDFAFRSICIGCGSIDARGTDARTSFSPLSTLARGR
jgi:hypothetical protein